LAALGAHGAAADEPGPDAGERAIVFGAEGNRLRAYDAADPSSHQVVIPSAADVSATPGAVGLDINAQICFHEFGGTTYFIAGEDTGQTGVGSPGWGWFELVGDRVGTLSAVQHGKLIPTWSQAEGPENYGCGFLPDGRLLLSDVGNQLPHEPSTGQLHLWEPDPHRGFDDATHVDVAGRPDDAFVDNRTDGDATGQRYCMIDRSIGTAGGISVHDGWAYVASNRPGPNGSGGVYRYRVADLPAPGSDCAGLGSEADLVDAGVVTRELWLPSDPLTLTPSAIAPTGRTFEGHPTFYVSSVFTGVIAEYVDLGHARVRLRNVVEPPAGLPIGQLDAIPENDGGTPFGLGVTPWGDLWYADLGIQGAGPAGGRGSVQRVTVDSQGTVITRAVVLDGLDFPDGIGVLVLEEPVGGGGKPTLRPTDRHAASHLACEWAMYGQAPSREFSLPDTCASPITPATAPALVPKWFVKTERTVTASPAVAGGAVYVGDWGGTFHALDADTGAPLWTFQTDPAPGAAFGPIVSSAAVVDGVRLGSGPVADLVVFGAGPVLYALDAATGAEVWRLVLDEREGTPVQIESSPVVSRGIVYVGIDNHNTPGTGVPGGLLAVDAASGSELGRFEPELGADDGCGGVWSSPVVNHRSDPPLVYLATANCPRDVDWTPHTEAVTALDARNLSVAWTFRPHEPNRRDEDFGATGNLFPDAAGRLVLGIGNKDGTYYALDPQTGDLRWRTTVAEPGNVRDDFAIGGFLGSTATWRGNVFGATALGGAPYYHSLDGESGAVRWRGAQAPSYAASAVVNGVVLNGALDSVLRAYDAATGAILWASPLAGPVSSGPAVVGDSVYVGSGTSSSDACAKELPVDEQCTELFDSVLGSLGGVHAFEIRG
ncbi:MAG TPA: PQQ-binding-like beta-propeller repeat protein, partial [Acidimicrobiia bacterium]|nr:PQQ-binding-like beta-propeller repeat protein [Acidimicrobiia bacterium]